MRFQKQNLTNCQSCAIREASLFGELKTEHLDKVRSLRKYQTLFSSGEYIYHEGDIPNNAFTLYEGWVILFKNLEDGGRQILRFALPGDFLGYKTKQNRGLDHSAIAVTDVTLCSFPIQDVKSTIADLPELSIAISSITDQAIERCHSLLTSIASRSSEYKISYLLLSLYGRSNAHKTSSEDGIGFPITQEDVGDALGLTSIHVNRVFQKFRKLGFMECKNKHLRIFDESEFAAYSNINLIEIKKQDISI